MAKSLVAQAALAALEVAGPDVWVTLDAERPREGENLAETM